MACTALNSSFCGCSCTPPPSLMRSPARAQRMVAAAASASYFSEAGPYGFFGVAAAAKGVRQQSQLSLRRLSRRSAVVSPLAAVLPPPSTSVASRAFPSSSGLSSVRFAAAAHVAKGAASQFERLPLEDGFNRFRCPRQLHAVEATSREAVFLWSYSGKGRRIVTRGRSGQMNVFAATRTRTPLVSPCCISQAKLAERTFATCCPPPTAAAVLSAAESSAFSAFPEPPENVDFLLFRRFPLVKWLSLYKKLWSVEYGHVQSVSCSTDASTGDLGLRFMVAGGDAAEHHGLPDAAAAPRRWSTVTAATLRGSAVAAGVAGGSATFDEGHRASTSGVAAALRSAVGSTVSCAASAFNFSSGSSGDDSRSTATTLACGEEGTKKGDFPWQTPFFCSSSVLLPRRRGFTSVAAAAAESVAAAQQTREPQQEHDLLHSVKIPPLGDSVTRGSVLEWRKKLGDPVQLDEVLCVIETDKVTVEIHSDCEGVVVAHGAAEGESLNVGDQLALIQVTDPAVADVSFTTAASQTLPHGPKQQQQHQASQQQQDHPTQQKPHQSPQQQQLRFSQQQQQDHSAQQQQHQSSQQQHSQQPGRQMSGDTANQQLDDGGTAELPAAREEDTVAPQGLGETAGAASGDSENQRTGDRGDDYREARAEGNAEKQQDRRRHVPSISFGKRRKATLADQDMRSPQVIGDPAAGGGHGDAQQQRPSDEAAAADAGAAQDEDPLMQLWGVPRWRPLSEEEIEAVNLGGAGAGANALGAWKAAVVQTQEKQVQKKQQKTKPKEQKAS